MSKEQELDDILSAEQYDHREKQMIKSFIKRHGYTRANQTKAHIYQCKCCHCGELFEGDKREVSCSKCSSLPQALVPITAKEMEDAFVKYIQEQYTLYPLEQEPETSDLRYNGIKLKPVFEFLAQRFGQPRVPSVQDILFEISFTDKTNKEMGCHEKKWHSNHLEIAQAIHALLIGKDWKNG